MTSPCAVLLPAEQGKPWTEFDPAVVASHPRNLVAKRSPGDPALQGAARILSRRRSFFHPARTGRPKPGSARPFHPCRPTGVPCLAGPAAASHSCVAVLSIPASVAEEDECPAPVRASRTPARRRALTAPPPPTLVRSSQDPSRHFVRPSQWHRGLASASSRRRRPASLDPLLPLLRGRVDRIGQMRAAQQLACAASSTKPGRSPWVSSPRPFPSVGLRV